MILVQNPLTRWVGLGWIVPGFVGYAIYRRCWVRAPLTETLKAPPAFGAALALEYRRIVVPIVPGRPSDDALDVACRLAAERGARVVALTVIEVPLELPLDAELPDEERRANDELDEAVAIGETYGVRVVARLVRGRSASTEIVREAQRARRRDHRAGLAAQGPHEPPARRVRLDRRPGDAEGALPRHGHGVAGAERGMKLVQPGGLSSSARCSSRSASRCSSSPPCTAAASSASSSAASSSRSASRGSSSSASGRLEFPR